MRHVPLPDPGIPDVRGPGRYLWWLARGQWRTMLAAMGFGVLWMVAQALMPALIGRAVDDGVTARDRGGLLLWAGVILAVGVVQALTGVARHRFAVVNWLTAAYRTVQLVTRHATRLGTGMSRRVATGEVVAIGTNDLSHLGNAMDVTARAAGAVVSIVAVAAILLRTSVTLGLVVLLGVPLLVLAVGPLLRPLQRRTLAQRDMMGRLSNLATDIVSGLRVLRGIGGERVFWERYVQESQQVRAAGVRVARLHSVLDSLQVLIPGLFVVLVVWLGARFAVAGRITPGELIAFYGYAAFLVIPLRTLMEFANKWIRAFVASRRVVRVLSLEPELPEPAAPLPAPPPGSDLVDHASGLRVRSGVLTAVVAEPPEDGAELADRLGRFTDGDVTWGGVPLARVPLPQVRERVVVCDTAASLFSGILADELDVRRRGEDAVAGALFTASADDVLDGLGQGLDSVVAERGRSFSGGQRQRLVLARALAADPEVLVLVQPTSAVDAHTEARIAARMAPHRAGRTTVVTTSSPLLLDRADVVALVRGGVVVAEGTHRELLQREPAYRAVVTREEVVVV